MNDQKLRSLKSLKKRAEIVAWLDSMEIKNYTIQTDFTLDVIGDVDISKQGLTSIPVKFNCVSGNFLCHHNELTSLENCPHTVGGYFSCHHNRLISLLHGPKTVGSHFSCSDNLLTSLRHSPEEVRGIFDCSYNQLSDLRYVPKNIGRMLICYENQLTTLDYFPELVGGYCILSGNPSLGSMQGTSRFSFIKRLIEENKTIKKEQFDLIQNIVLQQEKNKKEDIYKI